MEEVVAAAQLQRRARIKAEITAADAAFHDRQRAGLDLHRASVVEDHGHLAAVCSFALAQRAFVVEYPPAVAATKCGVVSHVEQCSRAVVEG